MMDSLDSFYGIRPTETVPQFFEWRHSATSVFVTGDFVNWGPGLAMVKESGGRFVLTLLFRPGQTVCYKFIVDGEWSLNPDLPVETDADGNRNHVLRIAGGDAKIASSTSALPVESIADGATRTDVRRSSIGGGGGPTPVAFGGYIGAGVHREYSEEYGLEVNPRSAKSGMMRSMSLADVGSLNLSLLQPWGNKNTAPDKAGRAKGASAARGLPLPKPAPIAIPASEAVYEFSASLDFGAPASPASLEGSRKGSPNLPVAAPAPASALARTSSGTAIGRVASGGVISGSSKVPSLRSLSAAAAASAASVASTPLTTVQASLKSEGKLVLSMVR
jgi:hypothetical protein